MEIRIGKYLSRWHLQHDILGYPKYEEPIYSNPVVVDPQITIGGDLSQQYFGLRKVSADTTIIQYST